MKNLLTLIFVIFPLVTFGKCLEINGNYTCSSQKDSYSLDVSTKFIDGVYAYEITEGNEPTEIFMADGKERPFEEEMEEGIQIAGTFKTVCDPNSLNIHMSGKVDGEAENIDLKITAKLKKGILYLRHRVLFNTRILDTMFEECTLN